MIKEKHDNLVTQNEKINNLYNIAKSVAIPKNINEHVCSGSVGSAVLTKSGKIYTGVCIDTECSLGMCAERNAISTMITNGEYDIELIVAVNKNGKVLSPCGACRELMTQLTPGKYHNIEIMLDYDTEKIVTLGELTPEWWI